MSDLAFSVGLQAYVFGYPTMDLYRTFWENCLDPGRGHDITLNEFNHSRRLVTPDDTWVVTPNNDTLYSRAFLDLSDEPMILEIPAAGERSYWFPIGDMYHNLDALLSWDTVGPSGGAFALCPPTFSGLLPEGVERVEVETPFVWMVGRYSVENEADVSNVVTLQDATRLVPLSQWGRDAVSTTVDPLRYPEFTLDGLQDARAFFTVLNEMLRRSPRDQDRALLGWFHEIGLHPHQRFDWASLDAATRDSLDRAVAAGHEIVSSRSQQFAAIVNGWVEVIVEADMSDDPVNHAGLSMMGLLYSQKEASTYHVAYVDADGETLDGSHKYTLALDPPPPVETFWSVTIYSAATRQYVVNSIDRYAIGDRTPGLRYGEDGSVELLIQHDEPADTSNWLPAPAESFYLVLREYSSKAPIFTREWVPPGVQREA